MFGSLFLNVNGFDWIGRAVTAEYFLILYKIMIAKMYVRLSSFIQQQKHMREPELKKSWPTIVRRRCCAVWWDHQGVVYYEPMNYQVFAWYSKKALEMRKMYS